MSKKKQQANKRREQPRKQMAKSDLELGLEALMNPDILRHRR